MDLGNIAVIAVALAGLLLAPFIAESVTSYAIQNYNEALAPVFNETPDNFTTTDAAKYPGRSSDLLGPEEYRKEAETPFGRFSVRIRNSSMEMALENVNGKTRAVIRPDSRSWELETEEYRLVSSEDGNEVREEIHVPDGGCLRVLSNGTAYEECWGRVSEIDEIWEEAKAELKDRMEKMKAAAEELEIINLNSNQWKYR